MARKRAKKTLLPGIIIAGLITLLFSMNIYAYLRIGGLAESWSLFFLPRGLSAGAARMSWLLLLNNLALVFLSGLLLVRRR